MYFAGLAVHCQFGAHPLHPYAGSLLLCQEWLPHYVTWSCYAALGKDHIWLPGKVGTLTFKQIAVRGHLRHSQHHPQYFKQDKRINKFRNNSWRVRKAQRLTCERLPGGLVWSLALIFPWAAFEHICCASRTSERVTLFQPYKSCKVLPPAFLW